LRECGKTADEAVVVTSEEAAVKSVPSVWIVKQYSGGKETKGQTNPGP